MAGIYIHIPYCKQKCSYCNFHFSTNLSSKQQLLDSIKTEIKLRQHFFESETIQTVYFGGGTPSVLGISEIEDLLQHLNTTFDLSVVSEFTLEANPDDLSKEYMQNLKKYTPINRLSIGIQSFLDDDLRQMNRAHNSNQAKQSLEEATQLGFSNLNADLIFALPWQANDDYIHSNIETLTSYDVNHISCYQLTVEPKTLLQDRIKKGAYQEIPDETTVKQFSLINALLGSKGFGQYEISNYCKEDNYAEHNTSYWKRETYLGLGPSAHSFKGNTRYWNVSNNALYMKALEANQPYFESEKLTSTQVMNEMIMTGLRTKWGLDYKAIEALDQSVNFEEFHKNKSDLLTQGMITDDGQTIQLTETGKTLCDAVSVQLFFDEE